MPINGPLSPARFRALPQEAPAAGHLFDSPPASYKAFNGQTETRGMPMEKFTTLTGVAAPMPIVNVDTDMIIPKDYLKTIKRTGLGTGLFSEMRYNEDGTENPDFVLNKPAYRNAKILVAGDNFGCGSSREHAPWALMDFGIRCVISTSFADIFYNNCFKNGILPIVVSQEDLDKLMDDAERGANATLTVDLEAKEIRGPDGGVVHFDSTNSSGTACSTVSTTSADAGKGAGDRRLREGYTETGPGPEDTPAMRPFVPRSASSRRLSACSHLLHDLRRRRHLDPSCGRYRCARVSCGSGSLAWMSSWAVAFPCHSVRRPARPAHPQAHRDRRLRPAGPFCHRTGRAKLALRPTEHRHDPP
jgi:3-isopropylmalate/(R)-2-methylmalate dehydratase small subunit